MHDLAVHIRYVMYAIAVFVPRPRSPPHFVPARALAHWTRRAVSTRPSVSIYYEVPSFSIYYE